MSKEKTNEEVEEVEEAPEENKPDVEEGTKTPSAIEVAEKLADRIDAGNKKAEEILVRQEELHAQQMLGGHSQAGQAPPPKETEDEKWAKDAKERYEGTGMDPTPDPEAKE